MHPCIREKEGVCGGGGGSLWWHWNM